MEQARARNADYIQFLSNPQKQGVWATGIQLDPTSLDELRKLLNLQQFSPFRYRYIDPDSDEVHGIPCSIIPRLFAYLRSLLPAKQRENIPPLFPFEREAWMMHRGMRPHRFGPTHFIHEVTSEPRNLSTGKKRALFKASGLFNSRLRNCTLAPVPERPSAVDVVSHGDGLYFQAQEDTDGRITVYSLHEESCILVRKLMESLPNMRLTCESRKLFSPETQLLAMYMPSLSVISPQRILRDAIVRRTIAQTMSEVREERFVHAIRAIGIGCEELIVEIYETYLHDKAAEEPLGTLLAELNAKIQEVVGGVKPRKKSPPSNLRKTIGTALGVEKKKANSNPELCSLLDAVLQGVVPAIERLESSVAKIEDVAVRPQRTIVFPAHVNRSLSDLVPLRNRVSHRVDRLSSSRTVTYLEAALALKSYIVLSLWWQEERQKIDYRVGMKEAIKKAIERNRAEAEE